MAEEFLTLMADLDEESQSRMSAWYEKLKEAGFTGVQTPGLPYHISLAQLALYQEQNAIQEMDRLAREFAPIPVHFSHLGLFAGGRILFAAPDMNPCDLKKLHDAVRTPSIDPYPWTPHATLLIDEAETVYHALPIMTDAFRPFMARITRLHLCAFWPTREIATIELQR